MEFMTNEHHTLSEQKISFMDMSSRVVVEEEGYASS
jgi:hypothetical protein